MHLWEPVLETPISFQPAKYINCWKDLHFFSLHRCPVPISNISSRLRSLSKHNAFEEKEQGLNDRKHVCVHSNHGPQGKKCNQMICLHWALHFLYSCLLYYSLMNLKFFSSALSLQPFPKKKFQCQRCLWDDISHKIDCPDSNQLRMYHWFGYFNLFLNLQISLNFGNFSEISELWGISTTANHSFIEFPKRRKFGSSSELLIS